MSNIIIFGCGGHARSVADILLSDKPKTKITFIDNKVKANEKVLGGKVVNELKLKTSDKIFLAIGDNRQRMLKSEELKKYKLTSIISKKSHIGKNAKIGDGCFVGNFCHIGPEASIGKNTIINNGAIVEHEVSIGNHCHIAPNVAISGRTKIGDLVFIGVGATVINNISICAEVVIGAGATVVNDITEPGTYIGTPAKKIAH